MSGERFERVHPFDPALLADPHQYEAIRAECAARGLTWYTQPHTHTCGACGRQRTHTGLEATREGDEPAHRCECGRDMREWLR